MNGRDSKALQNLTDPTLLVLVYTDELNGDVLVFCALGSRLLYNELLHVHVLGAVLRLPGRVSGEGVCSVRLRLWNT